MEAKISFSLPSAPEEGEHSLRYWARKYDTNLSTVTSRYHLMIKNGKLTPEQVAGKHLVNGKEVAGYKKKKYIPAPKEEFEGSDLMRKFSRMRLV